MQDDGIVIHNEADLENMRAACRLAASVLEFIDEYVVEGVTTIELSELCNEFIISHGATSATLGYNGFPGAVCTSVNDVICHGIPGSYRLKSGDIINIDVTVNLDGWHGDTSKTFLVGQCTKLATTLVEVAERALYVGISAAKPYGYFGDIGKAIQKYVDCCGFSIVRNYCGHGIGRKMHDEPMVIHHDDHDLGPQILPGMFFTIEPMINVGSHRTKVMKDGWTVATIDKSLSAQFEHTIAALETSVEIMTRSSKHNVTKLV
ncbi:MAG: type I methionyl aminopeptidase [Holosporales bacterium]|jgi:methionyl aminopeptidase|nr:type I methionyl aminopeptidase [Holosporales bacterium]